MLGTPQEFSHFELHTEVAEETRYDREILEDIRICMQEEENIDVTWAGAVFFLVLVPVEGWLDREP